MKMYFRIYVYQSFARTTTLEKERHVIPLVTNILSGCVGFVLEAVFDDGDFPRPDFIKLTLERHRDPSLILKSTCLDMKWSFLFLTANSFRRNSTHSILIQMLKIFDHKHGFVMAAMLTRLKTFCNSNSNSK